MLFQDAARLVTDPDFQHAEAIELLETVGFQDAPAALRRISEIARTPDESAALGRCLPMLLLATSEVAVPDSSLINFQRYTQTITDRSGLFEYLANNPRAVEILVKLFVSSQFLTEILLRNPRSLEQLVRHKRLAEFKSREEFFAETRERATPGMTVAEKLNELRRSQHWELLRIGACDSFGLMDLKTVTVQLSLLADSLVQNALTILAEELQVPIDQFVVIAFGKLGGEELNYSSDIDLVFVSGENPASYWELGQKLIRALQSSTSEGFLYRVDMRLRPWGQSGPLVTSVDAYVDYLKKHGMQWEKQALLKARPIAGNLELGRELLRRLEPIVFSGAIEEVRATVRDMKERIEARLSRTGREWGEVKSGAGSIRDIEFTTQFLQLQAGRQNPGVRSINTLDGLVRLADYGVIQADEYRHLSSGYLFLRKIEHSLQLMHYKQVHSIPTDRREIKYLARRLDFADADQFLVHYERHCAAIRAIYDKHLADDELATRTPEEVIAAVDPISRMEASYARTFTEEEIIRHKSAFRQLDENNIVDVFAAELDAGLWRVTVLGHDHPGDLSLICGLLFIYGFDIVAGDVFTEDQLGHLSDFKSTHRKTRRRSAPRHFVNVFTVRPPLDFVLPEVWVRYRVELQDVLRMSNDGRFQEAQGKLANRVSGALRDFPEHELRLSPMELEIDNDESDRFTVMRIRGDDNKGFLYELTNGLALTRNNLSRVVIRDEGARAFDTLYVTDEHGNKITDTRRLQQLRATVVLIKHFTHLLPRSPNPEGALLHFRDFLEQLNQQENWAEELSSLQRPDVLDALAKLLGVSDFLWEDFLRLQHANLFPIIKDIEAIEHAVPKEELARQLRTQLAAEPTTEQQRKLLNAFKDREMFRVDLRHIQGKITEFGQFSGELSDIAEVVVEAAVDLCFNELTDRYGTPLDETGNPCQWSVCALGKCGGRELGFASDIELMFLYRSEGRSDGRESISAGEFFLKLVEAFTGTIQARRKGIFHIDLRLRPYGRAGSLAVSLEAFRHYFAVDGPAWPYERQALVKLRPIAGVEQFGEEIACCRDELLYTGEPFDVTAMRAMRERQLRQLVRGGTFNAKLSAGGLVDVEYLVQGLQITFGKARPELRVPNTRQAMARLRDTGILSEDEYAALRAAHIFLRRLIDALRMVRGDARDLTVPSAGGEEFEFLARRLGYGADPAGLAADIERHTQQVRDISRIFDRIEKPTPSEM